MNTSAHAIFNLAILGRKRSPQWNPMIFWGALIPDLAMFVFYGQMKLTTPFSEAQIWSVEYYRPDWQRVFAFYNSIPLALLGLACALYFRRRGVSLLFASILLHCLGDLPLHHDDAHQHFWPLSNFRFESPLSYWDPSHYGHLIGALELTAMVLASVYVFRCVRSRWSKALIIMANALPLLTHAYFTLT